MLHCMIDLETLSLRLDAAIIQIGAVTFDPQAGTVEETVAFSVDINPTFQANAHFALDTITRWSYRAKNSGSSLGAGLDQFGVWWNNRDLRMDTPVWSCGLNFDVPMLQFAIDRHNGQVPWSHRSGRDTRTLFSLLPGGPPTVPSTGTSHDARDDAIYQARQVCEAYRILREDLSLRGI